MKQARVFLFLLVSFTASYAASRKQPIFFGCFLEWRFANNNRQGAVTKRPLYFVAIHHDVATLV
jgi:hypothetical protein